jgi:hypothetical protein
MNQRTKRQFGVGIGASSLLVVFVVLCLTTFAALSLVSARADRSLAQRSAQASQAYYAADLEAERWLSGLVNALENHGDWERVLGNRGAVWERQGTAYTVFYSQPISQEKTLKIEVLLTPGGDGKVDWIRQKWQVEVTPQEEEETPLGVLQ